MTEEFVYAKLQTGGIFKTTGGYLIKHKDLNHLTSPYFKHAEDFMSKKLIFLSLFICSVVYHTGCGSTAGGTTNNNTSVTNSPVPQPPSESPNTPVPVVEPQKSQAEIKLFEVKRKDAENKSPKTPVDLCYEVTGAAKLEIQPGVGAVESLTSGCQSVSPERNTDYKLIATDANNIPVEKTVNVEVMLAAPKITGFSVEPSKVEFGKTVKVCYNFENVKSAVISDGTASKNLEIGNTCVPYQANRPTNTVTLTITAKNANGLTEKESRSLQVLPPQQAQILHFDSSPRTVNRGSATQFCYQVSFGSIVSISNTGIQNYRSDGQRHCQTFTPQETKTYELIATGPNKQSVNQPLTITVVEPPASGKLEALPVNGGGARLCYEVRNIRSAEINTIRVRVLSITADGRNCIPVPTIDSTTYDLSVTDRNGRTTKSASVTIMIPRFRFELSRNPQTGAPALYYEVSDFRQARIVEVASRRVRITFNPARSRGYLPLSRLDSGKQFVLQVQGNPQSIIKNSNAVSVQ